MREFLGSIETEYHDYKELAEAAMLQLSDEELGLAGGASDNSAAVIVWHMGGNLTSRFTDFLTSDGEKPWRDRDDEFEPRDVTRPTVMAKWERGWGVLFDALASLTDADLKRSITIRTEPMPVHEALHRSLAHASYHVGQIVFIAKQCRGAAWTSLSIPKGQSSAYNRAVAQAPPRTDTVKPARP